MPVNYDEGKIALDALIEWAESNYLDEKRNEAATRLHLVDDLVQEVLGWPKAWISPEEPAGTGRIDYALGHSAVQLILEAKREGIYFELPAGTKTGTHSIQSLTDGTSGKPLKSAMAQAADYAAVNLGLS